MTGVRGCIEDERGRHVCLPVVERPRAAVDAKNRLIIKDLYILKTRSIRKMLGPFATASRRTPMSTTTTTTTTRDRGPLWPHGIGPIKTWT